jgi:uncharacterized membrane protein YkvA (DUF1232 family)
MVNGKFALHTATAKFMAAAVAAGYSPMDIAEDMIARVGMIEDRVACVCLF